MKKIAEITITKPGGQRLTVRAEIKYSHPADFLCCVADAFTDYIHDGDKIESIYFWEEKTCQD